MEKGAALDFSTALAKALFHTFQGNLSGIRFPEIKMAGLLQVGDPSVIGMKQQGDAVIYAGDHNALSGCQISPGAAAKAHGNQNGIHRGVQCAQCFLDLTAHFLGICMVFSV